MRKIEFHPLISISEKENRFSYEDLQDLYISCLTFEKKQDLDKEHLPNFREKLAIGLMQMYSESDSLSEFSQRLLKLFDSAEEYSNSSDFPSVTRESIKSTARNLNIASEITDISEPYTQGVLMSGSNAWGPFYAVRGNVQGKLSLYENTNPIKKEPSDIDMLFNFHNMSELENLIKIFGENKILSKREEERFYFFKKMYPNTLDMFSSRSIFRDTLVSFHFLPMPLLNRISNPIVGSRKSAGELDFARDFRPNSPYNIIDNKGYPIYGLLGGPLYFSNQI